MKEDFIGFTNITGDTTGENIAHSIIDKLQCVNLDIGNMRAQAYDGTGKIFKYFVNVLHRYVTHEVKLTKIFFSRQYDGGSKRSWSKDKYAISKSCTTVVCKSSAEQSNCAIMHRTMYQKYDWDNR